MVLIVMAHNSGGSRAREVVAKILEVGLASQALPTAVSWDLVGFMSAFAKVVIRCSRVIGFED